VKIFRPDLIILDLRMPEMNGPQFLDCLENESGEILEQVPIVFSSTDESPGDARVGGSSIK